MAVLIEGFTIVLRIAALEERYPGGWNGFLEDLPDDGGFRDGELVALRFDSRPDFRAWLEVLARRGLEDAATILGATELSERIRPPEKIAELQERIASTRDLALVYRRQPRRPEWLEYEEGRIPGTDVVVGGARLREAGTRGLAIPEGWSVEQAVPLRHEPESGDEMLPTWHEFLRTLTPESRAEMLRWGPEAAQSLFTMGEDGRRLFAGPIRPSPNVIEQEEVVRDPDGTEHVVRHRWTKLPK